MLKELFIVSESGTIITYENFGEGDTGSRKDPTLISAFITAIQGFSRETFNSRFKGMELENESIFIIFDNVYFIGIFSYDELEVAAFNALGKISSYFNSNYNEKDYNGVELELGDELRQTLQSVIRKKVDTKKIVIASVVFILASLLYNPILDVLDTNDTAEFYSYAGLLVVVAIFCGMLVPQRWISLVLSTVLSVVPSLIVFFSTTSTQSFVLSDYVYVMGFFPWMVSTYILDRRYINTGITSRIPLVSRIF